MSDLKNRELILERIVSAPIELVWRCWTEAEHLKHWFTPKPWQTIDCTIDLRVGGAFNTVMKSPEGEEFPNLGVFLEIIKNQRLVFTDAYSAGWNPSENPFFTAILDLKDLGGGQTKYTARGRHWTIENCKKHEEMGFQDGWGKALDQLVEHTKMMR